MESAGVKNKVAAIFSVVTEKVPNKLKNQPTDKNPKNTEQKSSEAEIDSPVCRICLEDQKKSGLISPCCCSGSCALVHLKCLQLWLTATPKKMDACEICQSPYKLKILRINPHFSQYICQTPSFTADILGFIIMTTGILFLLALAGLSKTEDFFVHENAGMAFGISFVFFLALFGYSFWIYTLFKVHIFKWTEFKIQHQKVKLSHFDPENLDNNDNNKNAVSMETETDGNVESKGDLAAAQNTVIQINSATSGAPFNSDNTNQNQNPHQLSSAFVHLIFQGNESQESNPISNFSASPA